MEFENKKVLINISFEILSELENRLSQTPAYLIVVQIFFFFLLETLGNFLLLAMIVFEKYGMDPQKRTASNQLLSINCILWIFHNLLILPVFFIARIYGPQSKFCINVHHVGSNFPPLHNSIRF